MTERTRSTEKTPRERRLAAALRENVRRRKAQARARALAQESAREQEQAPATHDSAGIPGEKKES
jgi:hypothetical protein